MKRKLALLLAAVMLISAALPMNLLAVTNARITTYISNHGNGSVMPDTGNLTTGVTGDLGPGNLRYNRWNTSVASTPYSEGTATMTNTGTSTGSIFANDGSGSYMVLEFPTGYNTGSANKQESFTITLENAVWYFYSSGTDALYNNNTTWNTTYGSLLSAGGTTWGGGTDNSPSIKHNVNTTGTMTSRPAAYSTSSSSTSVDWLSLDAYATSIPADSPVAIVYDGVQSALSGLVATTAGTYNSYLAAFETAVTTYFGANWKFADGTANAVTNAERTAMVSVASRLFKYLWTQAEASQTTGGSANAALNVSLAGTDYDNADTSVHAFVLAQIVANASHTTTTDPYGMLYNAQRTTNSGNRLYTAQSKDTTFVTTLTTDTDALLTTAGVATLASGDASTAVLDKTVTLPVTLLNAFSSIINGTTITNNGVSYTINAATVAPASFGMLNADTLTNLNQTAAFSALDALSTLGTGTTAARTAYMGGDGTTSANPPTAWLTGVSGVTTVANQVANLPLAFANVDNLTNTITTNWATYEHLLGQATTATALTMVDGIFDDMETQLNNLKATATNDQYSMIVNGTGLTGTLGLRSARTITLSTFTGTSTSAGITINNTYAEAATKFARENNSYNNNTAIAIPYSLAVDSVNAYGAGAGKTATITFDLSSIGAIQAGDMIIVPLVIKTLSSASDVSYTISTSTGAVSQTAATVISASGTRTGITTTSVKSVANAAYGRIYLSDLVITERSLGLLTDGTIFIIPPKGYEALLVSQNAALLATSGLHSGGLSPAAGTYLTGRLVPFNDGDGQRNALALTITGFNAWSSRTSIGTLTISGIALNPLSNDPDMIYNLDEDVYINVWNHSRMNNSSNNSLANTVSGTGNTVGTYTYNFNTDSNFRNDMGVTTQGVSGYQGSIKVASRSAYDVSFTAESFETLYSGKKDAQVALVTIAENTYNSWNARQNTTFTLVDAEGNPLEGIKYSAAYVVADYMWDVYNNQFRAVAGSGTSTMTASNFGSYGKEFLNLDINEGYTLAQKEYSNASFTRDGGIFRLTDLYTASGVSTTVNGYSSSDTLAKMEIVFLLSADANFEGEVYIELAGSSLSSDTTVSGIVKVAEFYPPVTVSTQATEVQMGYQKYNVADIVITENFDLVGESAYEAGKKVQIAVGEYGAGRLTEYIYFAPVAKADVTMTGDPNFTISDVSMVNLATSYYSGYSQRVIEFTVMRKSKTMGSEITIKNLEVNIGRDTPQGEYDLLVGGSSIVDNWISPNSNYLYLYDQFDVFGVIVPGYINMMTEPSNVQTQNTVTLKSGTNIIQVNGKDEEIPVPVLNVDGRMYVPIRFAAVALNVPDSNIIFDEGSRKVVITTAERIVTFQQDSPIYTINGVELSMNEGGVEAVTFIDPQTDRAYIPVRFLAYALNVSIDYDAETGEAILNAK